MLDPPIDRPPRTGRSRLRALFAIGALAGVLAAVAFAVDRPSGSPTPTPAPTSPATVVLATASPSPTPAPPSATASPPAAVTRTVRATVRHPPGPRYHPIQFFRFLDAAHGWAWSKPWLLYTDDGGRSWTQRSRVPGDVSSLSFVSLDRGWLAGSRGLVTTIDGGRTWTRVSASPGRRTWWVQFIDEGRGWALTGRRRFSTTGDGGATWVSLTNPCRSFEAWFAFASPETGWFLCASQPPDPRDALYRTNDGGRSWQLWGDGGLSVHGAPSPAPYEVPGARNIADFVALDADHLYIAASHGVVYGTVDGAKSWRPLLPDANSELYPAAIQFVSPETGLLAFWQGGQVLVRTEDGGRTWEQIYPRLAPTGSARFVDATHGYGGGTPLDPLALLVTEDGGRTWRGAGELRTAGDAFGFVDRRHGWVLQNELEADEDRVWATDDGGATWSPIATRRAEIQSHFFQLSFVDPNVGFAATGRGGLWVTRDGGRSFEEVLPNGATPLAVDFATAEDGWGTRDRGTFLVTADGGRTWRPSGLGVEVAYFDLVSPEAGWAATFEEPRRLLKTLDGGKTWTHYDLGRLAITDLSAVDADHAWITGRNGCLYATADGGATWEHVGRAGWGARC